MFEVFSDFAIHRFPDVFSESFQRGESIFVPEVSYLHEPYDHAGRSEIGDQVLAQKPQKDPIVAQYSGGVLCVVQVQCRAFARSERRSSRQ